MRKILTGTSGETNMPGQIGRFMFGVGAIIKHPTEDKILITKRANTDFQNDIWELMYGRVDHGEELTTGLLREIEEELGPIKVKPERIIGVWHFYRGEISPENEIYGVTFIAQALDTNIKLNEEHSAFQWVNPQKALELITTKGIRNDIEKYLQDQKSKQEKIYLSDINHDIIDL
jgi:8-oxo-dGTP pyrophosphatase MutT (NUDIX family)